MIRTLTVTFSRFLLLFSLVYTNAIAFGGSEPSTGPAFAPKLPERQRYLAIVVFNYEDDPQVDDERIENAGRMGCNAAEISVHWDKVYPTRNSAPNWRVVDSHVNTALRMGMKVAIRIQVAREPNRVNGFWNPEQTMQGGDDSKMSFGGAVQFSFAHQPTLELAKDFVRQVSQHFQYLQQQDQLLFMSVTASPIQEAEYSPRNERNGFGPSYPIPFDYSDPMKQGFRQWLQGRFSLEALNRRWGSDFSRWESVVPPPYNQQDPYISFNRGRWGEDWYVFRHLMLKRFIDETTRTVKEVNGSIPVVNQHGCVWDRQSGLRGTFGLKSLAQNADGLKINDGPDYNHRYSMDVVRSNIRAGGWVCNEVDGLFSNSVSVGRFYDQVAESFEHGARLVTLANFGGWDARPSLNQLIQQVVSRGLLSQPVTQVQTGSSTSYKLSSMVRDDVTDPDRASDQWSRQYAQNGRRPVNIVINEDWLEDNANQDPRVVKTIPNQTAYVEKAFEFNIPTATFEDPDGSITKVEITSGLPAMGLSANGVTISGTPNATGTFTVTVRAFDNKNSSVSTQFQITVQGPNSNQAPVVNQPIADRSAVLGQNYSYRIPDETFKDPDGRIVSINVSDLPVGLAYDTQTLTISGKPTNEGVSTINLKATDDKGTSVSTSFKLTVTKQDDVNKPPVVSKPIPAQTATVGQNFSYVISNETFSDPDGQITSLEVTGLSNGLTYDADSRTIRGTPVTAGTITVKVKANDNKGASVTTEFRFTINPATSPEQLAILEPTVDCNTGESKFRTSGGDGTKIEFKVVGITNDWTANTSFTIAPWLRNGSTFDIQARQSGKEIKFTYTTPCKGYEPPTLAKPMADQSYPVGQFFILKIPPETFLGSTPLNVLVSALPEGLAYDVGTDAISGTPTKAGVTTITVTATDDRGAKVEDVFVLTIRDNGTAPLAITAPTLNCQTGRLTINTTGGNGSAITYSIPGIADWNSNPAFTIGADKLSGTELRLLARQGDREVSYTYTTTCSPPGSSTLADQTIYIGESYSYTLPDPGAGITYKVDGLPNGLAYASANRTISGSPTQTGTTTVSIRATDDKGNTVGSLTFKLIVVSKSTTPVTGNFEGFLDLVSCISISGWVWDANLPNTPLTVEFLVGPTLASARLLGSVVANISRQDLRDNGKGNGNHGYSWDTPNELKDNQTYSIWARVQGSTYLLKGAPKTLTCAGSTTTPPTNQPPVAPTVAGLTATATVAYQTTLPVFTDPENGALTYAMTGLPAGLNFDAISRGLAGTVATAGTYKLTYSATDNQGAKTSIDITLTVNAAPGGSNPTTNQPPVAPNLTSLTATVNVAYLTMIPAFTDPEGGALTYTMTGLPAGLNFDAISRGLAGTVATAGTYKLTYSATDNQGAKTSIDITFTVNTTSGGTTPTTPTTVVTGNFEGFLDLVSCVSISGWVWDANLPNTPLTVEFLVGPTLASARLVGSTVSNIFRQDLRDNGKGNGNHGYRWETPDELKNNQTYSIWGRVLGSTYLLKGSPKTLTCTGSTTTPTNPTTNQPPVAPNLSSLTATANVAYLTMIPAFTDPEGGALTYTMAGLPAGLNFDAISRGLAGTVTTAGTYKLTYSATDNQGAKTSIDITFTVNASGGSNPTTNQPPVAPTAPSLTATATVAYQTTLPVFTDPENGPLTYAISGLPAGLNFDPVSRGLAGTVATAGTYKLTYSATDNQGAKTSVDITLTVNAAPGGTTPTTPTTVVTGNFEGYLDQLSCVNISGWVWDANLPNTPLTVEFLVGPTLASARLLGSVVANISRQDLRDNGKGNGNHGYSWDTPNELKDNQTYSIWARVQGSTYLLKGAPKTLTCAGSTTTPPTNQPPVAPTVAGLTATATVAYQTTLPVFTDPENGALTYAMTGLPAGLNFDAISRGLAGTVATAGTYKLTYSATDNQGAKTSIDITLTVNAAPGGSNPTTNQPPVAPNLTSLTATVNVAYLTMIPAFTDPEGGALTYTMTGLPAGLNFDAISRGLAGTVATAGTYKLTYSATDNQGAKTSVDITLTVNAAPGGSTPTNQPPVAPTVAGLTATATVAYQTVLPVFTDPENGALTYTISGLPAGLNFDPVSRGLAGTVATSGTYKLTYSATDNQGAKTSVEITLTVNPASTTPTTPDLVVLAPDYDCQTGRITFRTSGGDNTPIEYRAAGVTDWTTNATQTLYLTMRKGSTFDIEARQGQKVAKYTYTTACSDGKSPISDQVITKGLFYTFTLPEPGAGNQLEVSGLPDGINFNASNRTASGKPQIAGDYTVTVKSTGSDQKSSSITFRLTVREPQLTVQMMKAGNAASRQIIQELTDNSSIGITNLPERINFFCTSNVPVGSISFELTGSTPNNYVDNQAPFGLFGDDDGFKPQTGAYVLRLSAFTGANGSGELIITRNIAFSFVPGGGRIGVQSDLTSAEKPGDVWNVYPNPVRDVINLTLPDRSGSATPYRYSLSSATGNQWELQGNHVDSSQLKTVLDVKNLHLPSGLYFLQVLGEGGVLKVIKVLKQ
ncbi:putative Ig domain-containing protein [Larkinella rosea]|uniref:T9SS C-terminal target domain-containing protein n=1 Tax=Larkinella rosea TaxID=2025312 RepID=A0A3P1BS42_9BACT|nr:putative Ig domain-containing protein [Larkinella rosea]RRB03910.1 T9SS C-terminal target domain-containing protein [Larkinella rosea]